jgi:uncharacterized protein
VALLATATLPQVQPEASGSERARRPRLAGAAGVGALAGLLAGLFGVGGGILIVPGLVLLLRMEQRRAHGTSLAAIIPIAASGILGFALRDSVDWVAAALLSVGAMAGALLGTRALQRLRPRALRIGFALFLLATAVRLLLETPEAIGRGSLDPPMVVGLLVLGVVAGTLAGLFGVGGGILIIPVLVLLFAVPDAVAKGTSLVVILPTALVGTARNFVYGNADLPLATATGLSGVVTAYLGSQVAVRLDPRVSAVLFAILLVAVAIRMLLVRDEGRGERPAPPDA